MDFALEGDKQFVTGTNYVIQQIETLFDSTPGDTLGDMDYGTDYEYLLHDLKLNSDALSSYINEDLIGLDLVGHSIDVSSMLLEGTEREIALVNIDINTGNNKLSKTYNIK